MSRQSAVRRLEALEAELAAREAAADVVLLRVASDGELEELERLWEAGDESAVSAFWARLETAYGSGAGV